MTILNSFAFEMAHQILDAPLASAIMEAANMQSRTDHGPAPVIQSAPATDAGADDSAHDAGVVAETGKRKRPPDFGKQAQ